MVEYYAILHDGTSEIFRCTQREANIFAANPRVRFAGILGRSDDIPHVIHILRGDYEGPDYQKAKTFAQENL